MIEQVAIFLVARDDGISIEEATIMWNNWKLVAQEGHRGDCTNEPNTCTKCLVDRLYKDVDSFLALIKEAGWKSSEEVEAKGRTIEGE